MDSSWQWWTAVMAIALGMLFTLWQSTCKAHKAIQWPAGPSKLPIIGNLHQLYISGEHVHVTFSNMAQQYGRIMTIWLGGWRPTIVISDHELAREVLVTNAAQYASRKMPYMSRFILADWKTIASSNDGPYRDLLKKGLRNSALSPLHMSTQAGLQLQDMGAMISAFESVASINARLVWPRRQLRLATVRLAARLCFGVDFDDESFVAGMDRATEEAIRLSGHVRMVDIFSITRFIPGLFVPFKKTYQVQRAIENLIRPYLSRAKPNTYLHFLLSLNLTQYIVIYCVFEVFLLTVDSTTNTIAWTLAFLIGHQDIQEKLYNEIKCFTKGSNVNVDDVSNMHYLHAVVKECMRMRPIAPLAIPHMASKDCKLQGIKIPEGTAVMVNLYHLLYDPKVWHEPHRFMPERFLPGYGQEWQNGKNDVDVDACMSAMKRSFLPFGAGRRVCAGAEVAKLHVALTVANLVNAFKWSGLDGKAPDMREELTFVLMLKTPLVARIEPRHL